MGVRAVRTNGVASRRLILDAATEIASERGYSGTSIGAISRRSGLPNSSIYWHFENKVDLFDAMIQRVLDPIELKLAEFQSDAGENPVDALRAIALYFLDRVAEDPAYMRVLEITWHKCEYVGEMATIRDNHLECGNRYLDVLTEGFKLARKRGFLPASTDPRHAAIGLMALVDGLVVNWTLDNKLFRLDRAAPAIIDSYLAGLPAGS